MSGDTKKLVIVAILGVVLAGVLVYQFVRKPPPPPDPGPNAEVPAVAQTPAAPAAASTAPKRPAASPAQAATETTELSEIDIDVSELLSGIKEVAFDYDREPMPRGNPMKPLVGTVITPAIIEDQGQAAAAQRTPAWVELMSKVVAGIVWDPHNPVAVVDNEVVFPGYEYPSGILVNAIEPDRVVFKLGDSLVEIELKEQ